MRNVYFVTQDISALQDKVFMRHAETHWWQPDGSTWYYGVAVPRGARAQDVADRLTALGATVLPAINHPTPKAIPDDVYTKLKPHGVVKGDKTVDIAQKMANASGHPLLAPDFY